MDMELWFQRAECRATETLAVSCCSSHYLLIFRRDVLWFLPGLPDDGFSCNLAAHPFDHEFWSASFGVDSAMGVVWVRAGQGLSKCALKAWLCQGRIV